jgi:hypothetical protein
MSNQLTIFLSLCAGIFCLGYFLSPWFHFLWLLPTVILFTPNPASPLMEEWSHASGDWWGETKLKCLFCVHDEIQIREHNIDYKGDRYFNSVCIYCKGNNKIIKKYEKKIAKENKRQYLEAAARKHYFSKLDDETLKDIVVENI